MIVIFVEEIGDFFGLNYYLFFYFFLREYDIIDVFYEVD